MTTGAELSRVVEGLRAAPRLLLLLDYDGTLVPFAAVPAGAAPDEALLRLLERLSGRPGTTVHLVSGRARESLEPWLGGMPIWLHAEHGLWSRAPGGAWESLPVPPLEWRARARVILEDFQVRTPGSLIEEKTAGLAWHYRLVDPELGARRAYTLVERLHELARSEPFEVLAGEKVVEVRPLGVHKGLITERATRAMPAGTGVLAMGDDRTDEDLFAALPRDGIAVRVGPAAPEGTLHVPDWRAARALLEEFVDGRDGHGERR